METDDKGKLPSTLGIFHRSSSLSTAMFTVDGDDDFSRSGVRISRQLFETILLLCVQLDP